MSEVTYGSLGERGQAHPDAIVIGEVFSKKTAQTPARVIDNCRRRFRAYDQSIETEDDS